MSLARLQTALGNAFTRKGERKGAPVGAPLPPVGLGDLIADVFKTAEDTKQAAIDNWFGDDPNHQIIPEVPPEAVKSAAQQAAPVLQPVADVLAPTVAPVVAESVVDELVERVKDNAVPLALGFTGLAGLFWFMGKKR